MRIFSARDVAVLMRACRQMVYFFSLIGVMYGVYATATYLGGEAFSENGIVENTQLFFLSTAAFIFMVESLFIKNYRHVLRLLVGFCILGLFRECDALMDEVLPIISWRIGFAFVFLAFLWGLSKYQEFKREIMHFLEMPSFHLMMMAMVVIIPISQCLGHKPLIKAVVDASCSESIKDIRRMIEESGELCGYLILLFAAIEFFFNWRQERKHNS